MCAHLSVAIAWGSANTLQAPLGGENIEHLACPWPEGTSFDSWCSLYTT